MPQNKKYGMLDNYKYFGCLWWQYDKLLFILAGMYLIAGIGVAVLGTLLPSAIVYFLEKQFDLSVILLCISGVVIVHVLSQSFYTLFACMCFDYRVRKAVIQNFFMNLMRKSMQLSYEKLEEANVQSERKMAQNALENGMERCWGNTLDLIYNALLLLIFGGIVFISNPLMVAGLTVLCLIQVFGYKISADYEQKTKAEMKDAIVTQEYIQNKAFDVPAGKDIRLYQMQDWLGAAYKKANRKQVRVVRKINRAYFCYNIVEQTLQLIREVFIYGSLIYQISQGMNVSLAVLYLGAATEFANRFYDFSTCIPKVIRVQNWLADYRNYMEETDYRQQDEGIILPEKTDGKIEVEFRDVCFCYPGSKKEVLSQLNLKIGAGEKIALVGSNGAGKSTIVKLMCGFYSGYTGEILVNGINLRELNLTEYRKRIAAVFQKTELLSATISENVLCEEKHNDAEVIRCLKKVELMEKISNRLDGIHTVLHKDASEDGIWLSGGEEQKLLLARAIHKNAELFLLDEPTAAMDALAENRMYEQYNELIGTKSALFISHRLASTQFCDRILFLEEGKIAEVGTHSELMNLRGSYYEMFEIQSKYYKKQKIQEEAVCV